MLVAPGDATEEKQTQTQVGYCQHCKTMIPEDQWLPWDATNAASWAGHYYLDEIGLDAIPKEFLKSTADKTQDRVLTAEEKAIILEAVNNALADPLNLTQSRYVSAPQG